MSLDRLLALADRGRALLVPWNKKSAGDWWKIRNVAGDRAEVYIYGVIGDDWPEESVTAASFVRELRAITAPAIDLHINSGGGLVFDAVAIYAALRSHPATVAVTVDGVAASAASFVAMAGDSIAIEKPAKMMIHNAQGLTMGGPAEHRQMLDVLEELSDTIAGIYTDRAGGSVASWREAMGRETWYSAADAVKAGLADQVLGTKTSAPDNRRAQLVRARARVRLKGASK